MCGRYTLIASADAIRVLFEVPAFDERLVVPRYNVAPTQPIVVVRQALSGRGRELVPMRWGLIPAWAKHPADLPLLIMARADTLADKPAFRNAFQRRRCLIPASGFYEWRPSGKGPKQPFAIRPGETQLVAFAGLWETWCGNDGSEIDSAAIITTDCNEMLRPIHDRMPAVLSPDDFDAWLSPRTDPQQAHALLKPAPDDLFTCVPVSTRVNAAANDDPGLWERAEHAPQSAPDPESQQQTLL